MSLLIRKAAPADADALRTLYLHHLTQTTEENPQDMAVWREKLARFQADPHYHLLVGEVDGAVVSSVTLVIVENLTHDLRPYALIENVVTHRAHRGRHYATALMRRACEIAAENGCYKVMLLTGSDSIRDVILFPTMKPLDSDKKVSKEVSAPAEATQTAPVVEEKIDFSNVQIEPLFQDQVDFDTFSKSDFRAVKVKECEAVKKSKKLLKFVLDDGTGVDRVILSGIHEYYEPEELVGKTCIAITNLPPRAMMGIDSCGMLISAVHHENGEEKLHLLMVDPHIPAGAKLY